MDLMLDADVPEEQKIEIRLMKAHKEATDALNEITKRFSDPRLTKTTELFETRKTVLEYLGMVTTGFKQFVQTVNVPNENK